MIEERAVIVGLNQSPHPTSDTSIAWLEIERTSACGLCGQTRGCGNRVWGQLFRHQQGRFFAKNSIQANVGQSVIVAIDERSVMHAALLLYLLPIVTMLVLAGVAQAIFATEMASLAGAVIGLVAAWLWVKGFLSARPHGFAQPEIVRLASEPCVSFHS